MLKNLLKIFSNPIIYYIDKERNASIFRNYCFTHLTGCMYNNIISKQDAGKIIEYHLEIDKYLKRTYIITPIILYLIFIHTNYSFSNILFLELILMFVICFARIYASYKFSKRLVSTFGKYENVEFNPPISKEKQKEFIQIYLSKAVAIVILIGIFFIPAPILKGIIKYNLVKTHKYKSAISISKLYFALYPKNEKIYDMTAYAKYKLKDNEGSFNDYIKVLKLSGKNFTKKDITRLANILYLKKLSSTPNEALDLFNEYSTQKKLSILETAQLLWIKSIFKIENNIDSTIAQEYDEIIESLSENDIKNRFYILSDKAYMLYLMKDYENSVLTYDSAITSANSCKKISKTDLQSLYAERGFAKHQLGDIEGADSDFLQSRIKPWDMTKYEPYYTSQEFLVEKF